MKYLSYFIYLALGMVLAQAGVSIVDKPGYFFLTVFLVVSIDVLSHIRARQ